MSVASVPQEPPLNPFTLKKEERAAGNPLATFLEMLRLEKEFLESETMRSMYWQARATMAATLGDVEEANTSWDASFPSGSGAVLTTSPLEGAQPHCAIDVIVRAAKTHSWIMVGEEHVKPQTRTILVPLLRELRKLGFQTLAVETLHESGLLQTHQQGYAHLDTGTYTEDPVFAEGIREALRLGYRLVPYESIGRPAEIPEGDPHFLQNYRETGQARNLKERILDGDPDAKVLVWAGRAHVLETAQKSPDGEWRPMAYEFKRMTGIDPFSVYAATYVEASTRQLERALYKWATDRGLVSRPTIFVGEDGKLFGDPFDAQVFFPRTQYIKGRPDWLSRELGRKPVEIPAGMVKSSGIQLVQAFKQNEPVTAVPVDQALIRPGNPVPALMLPGKGVYKVRVLDGTGSASSWSTIAVD